MVKKKTTKTTKTETNNFNVNCKSKSCCDSMGCGYFLGFIGAAIYYISASTGFWAGVLGFLKALVWPAFVVYELMKFLGM